MTTATYPTLNPDLAPAKVNATPPAKISFKAQMLLAREDAITNWDQGCMSEAEMMETIAHCRGRLIGSDITGDVSSYRYRTWWKRWLTALDRQPDVSGGKLAGWQREQHAINLRLMDALAAGD